MTLLLCPICYSEEFETDDDGVITYCHNCGEDASGYIPFEELEEGETFATSLDEHEFLMRTQGDDY